MPARFLLLFTVTTFVPLLVVVADDFLVDAVDDGVHLENSGEEDRFVVLILSLLFGFIIIFVGSTIIYFFLQEDSLMRRYRKEGEVVRATVMMAAFARGGDEVEFCTETKTQSEFIVFVEYDWPFAKDYMVRVRKQVKSRQDDFVALARIGSPSMMHISINTMLHGGTQMTMSPTHVLDQHLNGSGAITTDFSNFSHMQPESTDHAIFRGHYFLDLLVLPGYVRSGHPQKSVERSCSPRSQMSTATLLLFTLLLATFCAILAAQAVSGIADEHEQSLGYNAIRVFLVLIVLQVPLVHVFLHSVMVDALRDEYLERGELVPMDRGSSSISSFGSIADLHSKSMSAVSLTSLLSL
jgi:hypothetical protein